MLIIIVARMRRYGENIHSHIGIYQVNVERQGILISY
jgi:hypothetical protein